MTALSRIATVALLGLSFAACVPEDLPPRPVTDNPADSKDPVKNVNLVWRGPGCGQPPPIETIPTVAGTSKGYTHFTVNGTGETLAGNDPSRVVKRTFWVRVPEDYDPTRAYRVVYLGQGCGTLESANVDTYALYQKRMGGSEDAIYVALDLPETRLNMDCYDNRAGPASEEWEAFQLVHDFVDARYCVDENRVFIAGYSSGAWLANMWGCYFAGIPDPPRTFAPRYRIRGQAGVTGGEPELQPACNGPVAALWIVDSTDEDNPSSENQRALPRVLAKNGCTDSAVAPWPPMPDVCFQYTACPKEYPVISCRTSNAGHGAQPGRAIPAFTAFFDLMNARP